VILVEGACPSEQVEIEIVKDNPRFLRARVHRIVKKGPARVEPRCEYFGVCGGCTLQHVSAEEQLASKQDAVKETIARIGGARPDFDPAWSGAPYGYRTRARFAIDAPAIGYRKRESREVVDVERCPILAPGAQKALDDLRSAEPDDGSREIEVVAPQPSDEFGPLSTLPGVFAQANAEGNRAMVAYVKELAAGAGRVLELYAGSGNFTRVLGPDVHAIEASTPATELAKRVGLNIENAPVEEALARVKARFDLVVLDPPRTGAEPAVLEHLLRLSAPRMVYVSCDPATFARDVKRLGAAYRLDRARVFDLYPQTAHVEVIGHLKDL
jgi:23S rRNA (uracil1939-C5)-methyltransferase